MSGETIADRRVHPGTIVLRFIKEVPSTVLALPAGLAFISDMGIGRALLLAAAIGVVMVTLNWLAWSRFRYGLGEAELVIESGILSRTRRSIPFDRIQDVDIEQPLLARLFGLAKVRIETGGSGADEGLLDSVTVAEAGRVRAAVRAGKGGAAVIRDEQTPHPLFQMDLPRVLLSGLFNFSLAFIAGIFAALQTFDDVLPFDLYDWLATFDESYAHRFTFGAIAAVLVLAVLLGIVAGILRTIARDYGFRLSEEGDRLRRERGLFTRTEVVLAKKRIQLAHIDTGPVRRTLGWFGLSFQTLGAGTDGSGRQSAAPFATRDELDHVLEVAGRFDAAVPADMIPVSSRHIVRTALWAALLPLTVILAASLWWPPALFFLAALPLLAAAAVLDRRFHRYALAGDLLCVMRGLWRQNYWIVPLRSVQAVSLSRSPLQRRLGLATLTVDTAGAPMLQPVRIVDLRLEQARELAAYCSGRKSGTER